MTHYFSCFFNVVTILLLFPLGLGLSTSHAQDKKPGDRRATPPRSKATPDKKQKPAKRVAVLKKKVPAKAATKTVPRTVKKAASVAKKGKAKALKNSKKPTSRPVAKAKKDLSLSVDCKNRTKYGRYCLGRVIGPVARSVKKSCPVRGGSIEVNVYKNIRPREFDSDFRPYLGRLKQRDFIWLCPKSGYAAFSKDFSKPFERRRMIRALFPLRRIPLSASQPIPGWYYFEAAGAAYWARRRKPRFFADLFLRGTWAAREDRNPKKIRTFRRRTIGAMKVALRLSQYAAHEKAVVFYLLAEFNRQERRFGKASMWMGRALAANKALIKHNTLQGKALERMIFTVKSWIDKKNRRVQKLPKGMGYWLHAKKAKK